MEETQGSSPARRQDAVTSDAREPLQAAGEPGSAVDLLTVLGALRRRWHVIVTLVLIGAGLGVANSATTVPTYTASSTVLFSLDRGQTVNELVQGATYAQSLVKSYTVIARSPLVLDPVIGQLDLPVDADGLARSISVEAPLDTLLMEITVTATDPGKASDIANAVARQLETAVVQLSPGQEAALMVTTIAPASPAASPSAPNKKLDLAVGLVVGLAAGTAAVLVLELLLATTSDRASVARATSAPVLAQIPTRRRRSGPVGAPGDVGRIEAYRTLRTNLEFLHRPGESQVLLITSPSPGDGKTTTAIALADVLASAGERVLLVDGDMRRPSMADKLGLEGAAGLSSILSERAGLDDVVQPWGLHGLQVVTAGTCPPNPSELLASATMSRFLKESRERFTTVVIDSAPALPVTDAALLSSRVDATLVVVNARRTPVRHLAEVALRFRIAGAHLGGVVVNRSAQRTSSYYGQRRSGRLAWAVPQITVPRLRSRPVRADR